ncbi:MAG: hypothetical protein ACE37H_11945 [Phycisphaeraceae bacterium]
MSWKFFNFLKKHPQHAPVGGEVETIVFTDLQTGQKIEIPVKGRSVLEADNGAPYVVNTREEIFLGDGESIHAKGDTCQCACGLIVKRDSTEPGTNVNDRLCRGCRHEVTIDGKTVILNTDEYRALRRRQIAASAAKKLLGFVVEFEEDER